MNPNKTSISKAVKKLPIVISSQRSGLNFVRVCIESLTGQRTPGKTLLIENHPSRLPVFKRTHDAANISEKEGAVWKAIDAQNSQDQKILLLLRNPFELFARELKTTGGAKAIWTLEIYISNLNHFCSLKNCNKNYFYYEDFTIDPKKMTDLIQFMDIDSSDGECISHEIVEREWNRMQEIGRDLYDVNQKRGGQYESERTGQAKFSSVNPVKKG
jgi:hypothetical protein